jgi:signal transduction histidine kinase/PAS domain-containing protein
MRSRLRILSIEADPHDTMLIQDLLETEGMVCEITRVDTLAAFTASVEQGGVGLILADYAPPSCNGISALKFAMKACPDVPFIFVSGTLGEEVAIEALKIGATDYVLKTRLSRLVPSVQRALGEATQRAERKRAEESLRKNEAYLAEAQRLSRTGSFGWNVSSGEIYWSDETYHIFEYERAVQPTLELVLQRIHPDDRDLVGQTFEGAAEAQANLDFEHRLLMPDGSVKYLHVLAGALETSAGSLEYVGAVTDVSAAKQAEKTLRESEAYLAEAQRLSHTGSWAWTPATGDIRYWSEECYRVLGFDPQAGLPRFETVFQRIHPDDQARTMEALVRTRREGAEFELNYRIVHPGGEIRNIHAVGHPVLGASGDVVELVGTLMDVTEQNRAEGLRAGESHILEMIARDAPLKEILEKLVRVVEAQFTGLLCSVLLLDEDGLHVRHGAAPSLPKPYTEAINGLTIGPQAGSCGTAMYRREPVVVTDILEDPLWEPYREVVEPYGLRACWSTPIVAHSGTTLGSFAMYYREPRSPSLAETRALEMATHLGGIAIERKLAREERERLRQAQADIAHINRVTTMGELTASLAHEIKQPMAAAVTDARTCLRWLGRDDPDMAEACEAASRLVTDVMRANEIIDRICLLFQKGALQREPVDLNTLVREMIVLLRSEAARYSISIRSDLAEDVPWVMADRVQLQQVFMNLMLNGIEAMKNVSAPRELTVSSQRGKDSQLLILVSDTGIGLPEQSERIFSPFFSTKPHGTGMGLPICRSIIESHGGRLWGTSSSGRGATFQFALPGTVAPHVWPKGMTQKMVTKET